MRALYLPGPSYFDENVKRFAGWWHILQYQCDAMHEAGYEVDVGVAPREWGRITPSFAKISAYSLATANYPLEEYDLIVGAPSYAHHAFFKARRAKKIAYVWNNADPYRRRQLEPEYRKFGRRYRDDRADRAADEVNEIMNRQGLEACDRVIACSPFVKQTHAEVVPEEKISIANWGVDTDRFTPPEESPPGFRVLFSGGDPIRKGFGYLLHALDTMHDYGIEVWVVGSKPFREENKNFKQFGLVPFDEVADIYRQCHVICIPTLEDGIACAIQEGMACGLVPIATEEAAEVFDKTCGFQVPYRDPQAIAVAIGRLKDDPCLLDQMGAAAREKAESQTWGNFKAEFAAILGGL